MFRTTINLRRQPKGFGIKGNRVTLRMADLIGLKDIDINVTGSHKPLTMINKSFIMIKINKLDYL